jgi:hypothetical protein
MEKNKENRDSGSAVQQPRGFIDPQPNAIRVAPIDDGLGPTQVTSSTAVSRKRQREGEDEEAEEETNNNNDEEQLSEDGGFQFDDRVLNPRVKPVAQAQPLHIASPSKRARHSNLHPQFSLRHDLHVPAPLDSRLSRTHTSLAPTLVPEGEVPPINVTQVNQIAKQVVAARAPRKVQRRRAWDPESCTRLIELIEDNRYQTKWSRIDKLQDPLLAGRDQVALKDKARNLKMDFVKYASQMC